MSDLSFTPDTSAPETNIDPDEVPDGYRARDEWEQALSVVPDQLRKGIYKQIRRSERESQSEIEKSRGQSVAGPWKDFADQAQRAGITDPEILVNAYNIQQAIANDPQKFLVDLRDELQNAVNTGQLTASEAAQALYAGQQKAVEAPADPLETPEMAQIRELTAQMKGMSDAQAQRFLQDNERQQQADDQQQEAFDNQQAAAYYDEFGTSVKTQMSARGYAGASGETAAMVMRIADSALSSDTSGTLSVDAAVKGAIDALDRARSVTPSAAQAPQRQTFPVGGGGGEPAMEAQSFANTRDGRKERVAAMIAAGQAQFASE
jgi:hypothetical protein